MISKPKLIEFWDQQPLAKQALQIWFEDASRAQWSSPQDIKRRYASASSVASNRVAFNIKGNEFRLVVAVVYQFRAVYIKFVGTHAQYDAIDAATVEPRP